MPMASSHPKLPHLFNPTSKLRPITCTSLNDTATTAAVNDTKPLRIAFAAGGTGGHIYPAVAIAEQLKLTLPNSEVLFLGRPDSMESAAIAAAGFDFAPITAAKLSRPKLSFENLNLPYNLVKSTLQSLSELREFDPDVVVGTGGYVSVPTCLASAFLRRPLVIHEQNSVPGIANWALSFLADAVLVAFDSTVGCFPAARKCAVVGNPVRVWAREGFSRAAAVKRFFPRASAAAPEVVVVLGGSLGAAALNIAMLKVYKQMLVSNERLFVIWQTGIRSFDEMDSLVKSHPRLHLAPFIHNMDLAYLAGDLIISRAGAMTCSEILAYGKPSILIPSPHVAEGHQFKNASLMADLARSWVITEDELDSTTLRATVEELLGDERKMAEMSESARKAAKPNASAEIVKCILSIVSVSSAI